MALTINTHPTEVITNAPEFDVSTSLTEGASYQNLRIRATVYIGGRSTPLAPLEQPKGLDDWNIFDTLKSLIGKCNEAVGGAQVYATPDVGGELLTSWSNYLSLFETFTTSGRTITSAIDSNASGATAGGNNFGAGAAGDLYVLGAEQNYNDSGAADFLAKIVDSLGGSVKAQIQYAGLSAGKLKNNHIYFMLLTQAQVASALVLESDAGSNGNVSGSLTMHKITNFKNNPGVYFSVKFEEVYENASDVTTIGAESWSDALLFVPVNVRPGESFSDYLMNAASKKLLTRAEDGDMMYKFGIDMEARLMAVCAGPYVKVTITTNAGNQSATFANVGWLIAILNDNIASLSTTDDDATIIVASVNSTGSSTYYTNSVIVLCEVKCFADIRALSFVGDLGEEIVIFRGLPSEIGSAEKSYYKDQNLIPKILRAYKSSGMTLRTLYETEGLRRLLHQLIYTELPVWMYNEDFTDKYREVTVLTDQTEILNQKELIEPEIEVVYYE